ncbi:MAG TPA: hypothetical protein VLT89_01790 [Usitatibacter sp.]|nr:hypothetical protein [Usitatibacter sp.]
MAKHQGIEISWAKAPRETNYPAALEYLSLVLPRSEARAHIVALRKAKPTSFKAKDIFRASGLSLLGVSNSHVQRDHERIAKGEALSPILLVRQPRLAKVIVADGYHRMCAVYTVDEDAVIPCRIV